jgi:hypothetical protein
MDSANDGTTGPVGDTTVSSFLGAVRHVAGADRRFVRAVPAYTPDCDVNLGTIVGCNRDFFSSLGGRTSPAAWMRWRATS